MGKKTHPLGFRLGITEDWKSKWFSGENYRENVLQDYKIRQYLKKKIKMAGIEKIEIERSLNQLRINISVARPGMVIGRGGGGVEFLKEELSRLVGAKVDLTIEEVKEPDLSADLVVESIVAQIEKRRHIKRVINNTAERVMSKGVKGVKIICSGRIDGAEIARSEKVIRGSIPAQRLKAKIDFARGTVFTNYGTVGVKVWIHKE